MTSDERRIATILAVEVSGVAPVWTAVREPDPVRFFSSRRRVTQAYYRQVPPL